MTKTPSYIAKHIRRVLKNGGSAPHSAEVQWFFKEEIASHGWYTGDLRKLAVRFRRQLLAERDLKFLLAVADKLFSGRVLEEKVFAIFLLEKNLDKLGKPEFILFCSWLDRVSSWADHDGLTTYLIGPMMVLNPVWVSIVFHWAKSKDRWHRRAAAVSLIRGVRKGLFLKDAERLSLMLGKDDDDMVQKGIGWLLREFAKYNRDTALPLLMKHRSKWTRLVRRTACETLTPLDKSRILNRPSVKMTPPGARARSSVRA